MEPKKKSSITVETIVEASIKKIWSHWTEPKHITQWYHASDDWHAPFAENDLKAGGKFKTTMSAKDGSFSFDLTGVYKQIQLHKLIAFTLDDGREVQITFKEDGEQTIVTETFEAEEVNSIELQKNGWQAILNNFKKYTEEA